MKGIFNSMASILICECAILFIILYGKVLLDTVNKEEDVKQQISDYCLSNKNDPNCLNESEYEPSEIHKYLKEAQEPSCTDFEKYVQMAHKPGVPLFSYPGLGMIINHPEGCATKTKTPTENETIDTIKNQKLKEIFLVIGILSAPNSFDERAVLRAAWTSKKNLNKFPRFL